jgi:hypothetical protein
MKQVLKYLPWIFLIVGAIVFIKQCNTKVEPEYITVEKKILVPSVEKIFDTIRVPVPVDRAVIKVEIDSTYYDRYLQLKDSIQRDSMFKEAIKINEHVQQFEDTLQTIEVYSKTRGNLLEQSVKYTTKPQAITVKDSVKIKKKNHLNFGAELGVPTINGLELTPVVKGNLIFRNKKGNTFSLGYDTEGKVWIGKTWKIW